MKTTNPFRFGSIVTGDYFYNRTEELQRIIQTLAGGNNLTLFAPRRYGKSSLVRKALTELNKQGYITVYLDLMSTYSRETFIRNYAREIAGSEKLTIEAMVRKIANLISGIVPSLSFDNTGLPTLSFSWIAGSNKEQTLTDVINLPQKLAAGKNKWIVAFDEFQEVTKLNGENFERLLRSCIQDHADVSYLFLGSKTHLLQDMFNNKSRAFYQAAAVMGIGKIEENQSIEFIVSRFALSGIEVTKKIAIKILEAADNIPYYIQFISSEIWQTTVIENQTRILESDVEKAIESILNLKADYYWELTNKYTAYRKKVLFAISNSIGEMFSKQTSISFDLGPTSTTQKALEVFVEEGIVEKIRGKFEFSDPVYKLFIQRQL